MAGRIAYFVTPHGYGHAARASAVMAALHELDPRLQVDIFTRTPAWFFEESLSGPFSYHPLLTDIGLIQKDSLREDLPATIERLRRFLPFDPAQINALAHQLKAGCACVICDIAPMGIAVARQAGLPSILIENFTWDWIYQGYPDYAQQMEPYIDALHALFQAADYHIQTEPVCRPQASASLTTRPVSRNLKASAAQVRHKLGISPEAKIVVLSMGGMSWDYAFLERLEAQAGLYFVIAGSKRPVRGPENVIIFGREAGIFHPDLVNAGDALIGKVGYSTLAETYQAGIPFGYIPRLAFRESPVLVAYIQANMPSLAFSEADLNNGNWLAKLPELLALPRLQRDSTNGAAQIARFVYDLIG
jgi:hypothetical protein